MKKSVLFGLFVTFTAMLLLAMMPGISKANGLTFKEQLGKKLFFDENLSSQKNQSCATCHAPETGFTGPDSKINRVLGVYPGSRDDKFGNRKPPTAAYGGDSPIFDWDEGEGLWIGGMFWDGRATGWTLGDPLAEQAQGPFLNPVEQALSDVQTVCNIVKNSSYAQLYEIAWGEQVECDTSIQYYEVYDNIGLSIAAYERSSEVNPFSSKYDYYLAGSVDLTAQEERGLELFDDPAKGNCAACHPSDGEGALFTDFSFDNLGIPKNRKNPFYKMDEFNPDGKDWVDYGLGGFLKAASYPPAEWEPELGKHKVPTLRNVDKRPDPKFVKAFGHNGYFKSLEEIVHFYNTRDVKKWPEPEVSATVNDAELGDLGLTAEEEADIVAFLKTLTDGYIPPVP